MAEAVKFPYLRCYGNGMLNWDQRQLRLCARAVDSPERNFTPATHNPNFALLSWLLCFCVNGCCDYEEEHFQNIKQFVQTFNS